MNSRLIAYRLSPTANLDVARLLEAGGDQPLAEIRVRRLLYRRLIKRCSYLEFL